MTAADSRPRLVHGCVPQLETLLWKELDALGTGGWPDALGALYLGGGYGRGEGGAFFAKDGSALPYNDLDFFAYPAPDAPQSQWAEVNQWIETKMKLLAEKLGIEADCTPLRNFGEVRRISQRLMFQELLRGHVLIYSKNGYDPLAALAPLPAYQLPLSEAQRLLLNRGYGLLLARAPGETGFRLRNLAKAALGAADALLLAKGLYKWNGEERAAAFRALAKEQGWPEEWADNYDAALAFKFRPVETAPAEGWDNYWNRIREMFLGLAALIPTLKTRSLKSFLRWILHTRSLPPLKDWGKDPIAILLPRIYSALAASETDHANHAEITALWSKFN